MIGRFRYGLLIIFNLSVLAWVCWSLVQLSLDVKDRIKIESNMVHKRREVLLARRGDVIDQHGQLLAGNIIKYDLWIDPTSFQVSSKEIEQVSHILNISEEALLAKFKKGAEQYALLAKHLDEDKVQLIQALNNPSWHIDAHASRIYPLGEAASTLLGIVDAEQLGIDGIEKTFENKLAGKNGYQEVLKDRHGQIVKYINEEKPVSGSTVQLTLDSQLQYLAYQALKQGAEKAGAKAASAVILDVNTGAIRAMVNWPSFDPNQRQQLVMDQVRNRAVTDIFEPGSTMKPFSMSHLLQTKVWRMDEEVDASKGMMRLKDGHVIRDVHVNDDPITMKTVLQKSSNVAVAKMMLRKPSFDFVEVLPKYGFCAKSMNGFIGETAGICHAKYNGLFELATLSFGYGIGVNVLQLAQAYGVIANKGQLVPAHIEKNASFQAPSRVIDETVAENMRQMLTAVLEKGGTGVRGALNGIAVAGKTGTTNLLGDHGYDERKHLSSFVGFAPADQPEYVVAVVIWEPNYAYRYGGVAAAPIFADMISAALGNDDTTRS